VRESEREKGMKGDKNTLGQGFVFSPSSLVFFLGRLRCSFENKEK
jgi:hypothetical protein